MRIFIYVVIYCDLFLLLPINDKSLQISLIVDMLMSGSRNENYEYSRINAIAAIQ